MTLRIGMIGPGGMGQAHIERIHSVIAGGRVVAVLAPGRQVVVAPGCQSQEESARRAFDEWEKWLSKTQR